jgi:acetyl-CoA carboxylase carboxyltransferase component
MTPSLRDRYLAKLKRLGQLSFEDRLKALFDPGTLELLSHPDWDAAWTSALVTARGQVGGQWVYAYASNFVIEEGTIGEAEADAIIAVLDAACRARRPVVSLLQSNGARVSERYASLGANAKLFLAVTRVSGVVPQIAAGMGLCLGVAAYLTSLADYAWMIPGKTYASTTSPAVIKVATGQTVAFEALGGADMHATTSGVAHFLAKDDGEVIAGIRDLLGYLDGRMVPGDAPEADLESIIPSSPYVPYDVHDLITGVFDQDSFLEVHASWGQSLVVGFARLDGRPVGVLANQSKVRSGTIDTEAARKGARFLQGADLAGLPRVYLVDVPGIMVSAEQEQKGILDAGAMLFQAIDTDSPRISVVVRKCFGGAFVMMQAKQGGGDRVFAYPTAQIGIAGAEATFAILHGKEYQTHEDAGSFRKETLELIRKIPSDAYAAQEAGLVDQVISKRQTREKLIEAVREFPGALKRDRWPRRHRNWQV